MKPSCPICLWTVKSALCHLSHKVPEILGKGTQMMERVSENSDFMFKTPEEHMQGDQGKD